MRIAILFFIAALISGCASFKNEQVSSTDLLDLSSYQNKPSVYIDVDYKFQDGAKVIPGGKEEITRIQADLSNFLISNNVFSEHSFKSELAYKMDYTLKVNVLNHGDLGAASAAGFITGYSLFLIPTYATDNFTVTTELYKKGDQVSSFNESDSMRTWFGLWFIPMMGSGDPKNVRKEVIQNLIIRGLNDLISGKKLEYSSLPVGSALIL